MGAPQMRGCHIEAYRLAGGISASLPITANTILFVEVRAEGQAILAPFYERHGTRLCAHALNPTMHRASIAKTATLNSASIMFPSTERMPLEGLICPKWEIFPVAGSAK